MSLDREMLCIYRSIKPKIPLNISTKEKTRTVKTPMKVVIGSIPANGVPANGTLINANPAMIEARNNNIVRSILSPPFSILYVIGNNLCINY